MDVIILYAVALGGLLFTLVLINIIPRLSDLVPSARPYVHRSLMYLKYPYLVHRHRLCGPWNLANIITQIAYIGSTSYCLGFQDGITTASLRAGTLSVVNFIPLFLGPHLSFLADVLGVSLRTIRQVHCSVGLMSTALVLFHALTVFFSGRNFALRGVQNISATVAVSSLALSVLLTWAPLRARFYEMFIRSHQMLAVIVLISALLHTPSKLFPRLYLYITMGIFNFTFLTEVAISIDHNVSFARRKDHKDCRVGEIFKYPNEHNKGPIQMTIFPKEPLKMKAGQYINICIPSLGLRSITQSHPFVVASWTGKQQRRLELVIQPRRGWTKRLHLRALTLSGQNGGLGRVFFTGPHGSPVPVDDYEHVFMIASGYGIVAQLPLLERLVQGTLAHEVRARRIRLVWEFDDIGLYKTVYPLLNWILGEDGKLGNSCMLAISLYSMQLTPNKLGKRARILNQGMPLQEVFDVEMAEADKRESHESEAVEAMEQKRAEEIERGRLAILEQADEGALYAPAILPVFTRTSRMLLITSASIKVRDGLRSLLWTSRKREITLADLDYQPSD